MTLHHDPNALIVPLAPPGDPKPVLSKADSKHEFLELSDLKGIKLQTWELKEEIGE